MTTPEVLSPESKGDKEKVKPLTKVPSLKQQEVIFKTMARFRAMEFNNDTKPYRWFGVRRDGSYLTKVDYINYCRKRWNSQGIPLKDLAPWQASFFKPESRNKVIAVLSQLAELRPMPFFFGTEKNDYIKSSLHQDIYNWSEEQDDGEESLIYQMLEAATVGTAIIFEGYWENIRVMREVMDLDMATGEAKINEIRKVERKLYSEIIPLEDAYFGDMKKRRMREQPDFAWRSVKRMGDFKSEFGHLPAAKNVLPGGQIEKGMYYFEFLSQELRDCDNDLVEVIRYFNREADEMIIIANGVWLNPLKGDVTMPLIWKHKELPFYKIIFEPFASNFACGKSLIDKLGPENDALNALYNMMMDGTFLSIRPIILFGGVDPVEDMDLIPGRLEYVGGDMEQMKQVQFPGPGPGAFSMAAKIEESMSKSSVSPTQQGVPEGGRVTATAVLEAKENAVKLLSLFLKFIYFAIRDKGRLRGSNILQFMFRPTEVRQIAGEEGEKKYQEIFQQFRIDNTTLFDGKQGTRLIRVRGVDESVPTKEELLFEKEVFGADVASIPENFFESYKFDVKIVGDQSFKLTIGLRRALELEWQKHVAELYPQRFMANQDMFFEDLAKVWEKDPSLYKAAQPAPTMPGQDGKPPSEMGPLTTEITQAERQGLQQKMSLKDLIK